MASTNLEEETNPERELTLIGHLDELRMRLIICVATLFVAVLASFFVANPVLEILIEPVKSLLGPDKSHNKLLVLVADPGASGGLKLAPGERLQEKEEHLRAIHIVLPAAENAGTTKTLTVGDRSNLIYTKPLDPVMMLFKVAIVMGILLSLFVWVWQVWGFIAPGLTLNERKVVKPMLLGGLVLFPLGAIFAYFMLYMVIQIMQTYIVAGIDTLYTIADYLKLMTTMMIVFGIIFELPLVVALMARVGIVTPAFLTMYRKHIWVGLALAAAILTPADPFTMLIAYVPLLLLFELSVIIARFMYLLRAEDEESEPDEASPA